MALLEVLQVCKSYGERRAVDAVSFQLQQGQTLGLIGPNGAGKSTTVGLVCGLLRADSGTIRLDGKLIEGGGAGATQAAKLGIGLVPQELALYEDLSALENLRLFGALYGLKGAALKARCADVLALVNLADRAGECPSAYSGGMKRRLNIAAALLHDPQLLILDEPTVGVDPQSRNAIFDNLETLKRAGRSLIYTSHYMEEVERLADHIVIIDHGKVLADASPAALYGRLPVRAALDVTLAQPAAPALLAQLQAQPGVHRIDAREERLHIELAGSTGGEEDAAPGSVAVLAWLAQQDCRIVHFASARTSLEDIFLELTGRSLRD